MNLPLAILATLMWLTHGHPGETQDERAARLWQIAVPLAEESRNRTEWLRPEKCGWFK
jgi:hypothetical protein